MVKRYQGDGKNRHQRSSARATAKVQSTPLAESIWSWTAVWTAILFLWAGAIGLATSSHPQAADVCILLGTVLLTGKLVSWEDARAQKWKVLAPAIAISWIATAAAMWGNHTAMENDTYSHLAARASIVEGEVDPLNTIFTVANGGSADISWYDLYCEIKILHFEGIAFESDEPKKGGFFFRNSNAKTSELRGGGGADSIPCLSGFPRPSMDVPFVCADVNVIFDYKIDGDVPAKRTKKFRFVTANRNGKFEWIEKNVEDSQSYCLTQKPFSFPRN